MPEANPLTQSFIPIAFMVFMSAATGAGILLLSRLLGSARPSHAGDTIYECGLDPMDAPNKRFAVKFYVVAMLFILFDVEIALLYPWAVLMGRSDTPVALLTVAFLEFVTFVALLVAGYVYLYRAGAFDWSRMTTRAADGGGAA